MILSDLNPMILTYTFSPVEGGIQTYMLQLAENWIHGQITVYCRKENNVPDYLRKKHIIIKRYNFNGYNYFKSLLMLVRLLNHKILKYPFFFIVLVVNRSAIKEIFPFIIDINKDVKISPRKHISFASVPIYTGLIAYILKILYGIPFIVFIHGSELLSKKRKNNYLLQKYILNKADLIIANSSYTKGLAENIISSEKQIIVINLASDTSIFSPTFPSPDIIERLKPDLNMKILLSISHLIPRKGQDMLIKALPIVIEKFSNLKLVIVGRGHYEKSLKEMVRELNLEKHVVFEGFIPELQINEYLNICDIFVMPNRQEGQDIEGYGIVFMDANACGKPVIGGRSGGVTDAIIEGYNGLLVDPSSESDIANKIIYLLSNPDIMDKLGKNGLNLIQRERNWKIVTKKIFGLIENINERDNF